MKSNQPYVQIAIEETENRWQLEHLFELVIRRNKKRSFLFASTVLGKYIAVNPYVPQLIGMILAEAFYEEVELQQLPGIKNSKRMSRLLKNFKEGIDKKMFSSLKEEKKSLERQTLFIGFAETATGLGHCVFNSFNKGCSYLHTTRMPILSEEPVFYFKEEHSHAVDHTCFNHEIMDFNDFERIVLVDDEITTGNTALNLIQEMHPKVKAKEFVILSILDWRSEEHLRRCEELEEELGIAIYNIALIRGNIKVLEEKAMEDITLNNEWVKWNDKGEGEEEEALLWEEHHLPLEQKIWLEVKGENGQRKKAEFLEEATGRFGLSALKQMQLEERAESIGRELQSARRGGKCLCLGTEEFIYWPLVISAYMGEKVSFACSARSPIITLNSEDYAVKDAVCFENPDDRELISYIYNLQGQEYEEVFWFWERNVTETFKKSLSEAFRKRGIKQIHFVCL